MKGIGNGREPSTWRGILISLIVGLAAGTAVLVIGGIPEAGTEAFWRSLCDAATVSGVLLTGAGLLSLVSDLGAFDGIAFPVRKAFSQILREEKRSAMPKSYYDYVETRKKNGRKKSRSVLWTGLFFLTMAGIFLVIYLSKYPIE